MAVSREKVVRNAEKYVSRGKIEAAIKEYRKLLQAQPNDISTLNRVGDLYARINRNSEAIELFHQIAEQYADDGFLVKAIAIYKKIIKLDPTLLDVYERLADLYHRQGLVNEARTQYQVLADYYLQHDDVQATIGIYRRMAELESDDPAPHAKLAEIYHRQGLIAETIGEYRAIADTMLAHDRAEEAAQVYERALAVSADDLGFITDAVLKLKEAGKVGLAARFLALAVSRNPAALGVGRIAGVADVQAPATDDDEREAAKPGAAARPAAPAGADDGEVLRFELDEAPGETPALERDFNELEIDLDLTAVGDFLAGGDVELPDLPPPTADDTGGAASQPEGRLDHEALERTAAEVEPERTVGPEDLFTEAEVLAKYGIEEKALERLAELLHREPDHLPGRRLMIRLHLDAGRAGRVAALVPSFLESAARVGDDAAWPGLRKQLVAQGYTVTGAAVSPPAVEEGEAERGTEPHVELGAPVAEAPSPTAGEEPGASPKRERLDDLANLESRLAELAGDALGRVVEQDDARESREEGRAERPAAEEPPAGARVDPLRALGESLRAELARDGELTLPTTPPPESAGTSQESAGTSAAGTSAASSGGSVPEAADRALPPPLAELEAAGVSWLAEVPPESNPELFEAESGFFDLGAELEQELFKEDLGAEELLLAGPDQSLEEIIEGFKRGVAENLSPEDYATHFNLGIAYREMGLLDEAIGEFQLAAKDPVHLVPCASLLGLCFLDKGLPDLAVKWYRRGLEAPNLSEDDQLGLLYDLGNAQAAAGERRVAYETFVEIYGTKTNYRDVVARLTELEPQNRG